MAEERLIYGNIMAIHRLIAGHRRAGVEPGGIEALLVGLGSAMKGLFRPSPERPVKYESDDPVHRKIARLC
jgi:hypothetical protein